MQLPNAAEAQVPERKLVDYLLDAGHADNSGKARFFAAAGYTQNTWRELAGALRQHAQRHPITETVESTYGTKYIVEGPFQAYPSDAPPWLRSVWMIDRTGENPRLVTAYPTRTA